MSKLATLLMTLMLAAITGMAATLNLTNLPGFTYGGYYVGQTVGNLDGGASMAFICNDFEDRTSVPSSFDVAVSAIPTLDYALYADSPPTPEQILNYEWAAILIRQMVQPVNQTSTKIGGIQFAIWNLFDPSAPDPGASPAWVTWVKAQNTASWSYSGVRVYTPTNLKVPHDQEFMSGAATPVPEPAALGAIGLALLLLGAFRKGRSPSR